MQAASGGQLIPAPKVHTYMVGYQIWELRRNMEAGSRNVTLTPDG